jgi:hypothetical protein
MALRLHTKGNTVAITTLIQQQETLVILYLHNKIQIKVKEKREPIIDM